ncbi:TonB-dependent receptor [Sulfurimonas sp. HSL3-7]|uniref:TonB-dependent receptor n=1 Tax=Sulfonitrofixus jiaomeiensis TaxID=3131938 RepID=UPI0031F7DCBA
MDRSYVLSAFGYAIIGLLLGIYMAASQDHGQLVTHAHIMLVGFVVSFIYGLCHKLWISDSGSTLARVQFYVHHASSIFLGIGLFLLYGNYVLLETIDPYLAIASIAVLIALIMMTVILVQSKEKTVT